jgi:uncharacterized integral membrane protein
MKFKIVSFIILIVLFTIFVSQNIQIVNITMFFWQFSFPAIILLVITGAAGLILGLIIGSILKSRAIKENQIHPPLKDNKTESSVPGK